MAWVGGRERMCTRPVSELADCCFKNNEAGGSVSESESERE